MNFLRCIKNLIDKYFPIIAFLFVHGFSNDAISSEFGWQEVKDLISDNRVSCLNDLLPLLPYEFRKDPVLIYASRSTQPATPDKPRVILSKGDFVLAYGGIATAGYDTLEMIQFNRQKSIFEFKQVKFKKETQNGSGESPQIIENPTNCYLCHANQNKANSVVSKEFLLRPIWGEYPTWRGAIGSIEDTMFIDSDAGRNEAEFFNKFVDNFQNDPRYSDLQLMYRLFFIPKRLPPEGWKQILLNLSSRNTDLTRELDRMNIQRLNAMIKTLPESRKAKLRKVVQYLNGELSNIYSIIPKVEIENLTEAITNELREKEKKTILDIFRLTNATYSEPVQPYRAIRFVPANAEKIALLILLLKYFELDELDLPAYLSLTFDRNYPLYSTADGTSSSILRRLTIE